MFFPVEKTNLSIIVAHLSYTYFAGPMKNDTVREYAHRNYNVATRLRGEIEISRLCLANLRTHEASGGLLFAGRLGWPYSEREPLRLPIKTKKYYVRSILIASAKKRVAVAVVLVIIVIVVLRESEASTFSISPIGSFVQSNSTPPPLRL